MVAIPLSDSDDGSIHIDLTPSGRERSREVDDDGDLPPPALRHPCTLPSREPDTLPATPWPLTTDAPGGEERAGWPTSLSGADDGPLISDEEEDAEEFAEAARACIEWAATKEWNDDVLEDVLAAVNDPAVVWDEEPGCLAGDFEVGGGGVVLP